MSEQKRNGGPAYPGGLSWREYSQAHGRFETHSKGPLNPGMSLRDYFAAKAMSGLIQNDSPEYIVGPYKKAIVMAAYEFADMMIEQREWSNESD